MITGKDVIMFILKYDLVNEEILPEKLFIENSAFLTIEGLAAKLGVGVATIKALYEAGMIFGVELGGMIYFSKDTELPKGDA